MISVQEVTRYYEHLKAVNGVSFHVSKGEIVGLLGPNGAGKTTLMKVLTGYHFPHEGHVVLNGFDIEKQTLLAQQHIGFLPEAGPDYSEFTVHEYLRFLAGVKFAHHAPESRPIKDALEKVLGECDLSGVTHTPLSQLSKGFRQRVGLAGALLGDPRVLILDEPTSGLDPNQIQEFRKLIQNLGKEKTVIISTHLLQEVQALCDRILIMNHGEIVAQGTLEELESGLLEESRYFVEVKGSFDEEILTELKNSPHFLTIDELKVFSGYFSLSLKLKGPSRPGAEMISTWAQEKGLKLLALVPESRGLEEVFSQIITGGSS